jgi:multidrug efflux pump subunit AcrA (membrane-fusion protein)
VLAINGRIAALKSVTVRAAVSAQAIALNTDEGESVAAGKVLVQRAVRRKGGIHRTERGQHHGRSQDQNRLRRRRRLVGRPEGQRRCHRQGNRQRAFIAAKRDRDRRCASHVVVIAKGVAERREIRFDDWPSDRVIVTDGLSPGDVVIIDTASVKPDEKVSAESNMLYSLKFALRYLASGGVALTAFGTL